MNVQVVSFQKPRQMIRGFPLDKRKHIRVLELPAGAQILSAEDRSHDGALMLWVLLPVPYGRQRLERRTILVTREQEEFEISEETIPGIECSIPNVNHIGMWVDRFEDENGSLSVTGHVLEVLSEE